ncbi:prolipoprotein diacylglyceryl transferase [Patescibacteria group bacterium]|nr:prolipoprotein diacylglyceryl transferase [Patescibacteria group bacterium]
MFFWLQNFLPQPVLLDLGAIKVHWYGLLIVLAIIVCLITISRLARVKNLSPGHLSNLFFYLIIFSIIGARLYHVLFYNFNYFINRPIDVLKVWQGGMAIHGAIVAGIIVVFFYCRKHQLNLLKYFDIFAVVLPLGQAIGRWGNFFNQELFGRPCDYSWCLFIQLVNRPALYQNFHYFHPVFLYESLLNIILFIILLFGYKTKKWPVGAATFIYLIGYSIIRFFMEFLRLDVSQIFLGLKWVQWLSLLIIMTVVLFWKSRKRGAL